MMIEIQAKLLRGPVYFVEETIQCLITLRNVPLHQSPLSESSSSANGFVDCETKNTEKPAAEATTSSEQVERLCWTNVQLHCFCLADENQINTSEIINQNDGSKSIVLSGRLKTKRSSIALEAYASNDTSFHESLLRVEKGIVVYSSKPKILFCDLQLSPHESKTYVYTETLPSFLNPSYSSPRLKYHFKLTIGAQRIGSPIYLLRIPIRVLKVEFDSSNGGHTNGFVDDKDTNSLSATFNIDEDSKDSSTPLDLALLRIEYLAVHRTPHSFNITSPLGRVAKFFIYKTVYRLGEDIIGIFNFDEGTVPCVRFSVTLQSEETISDQYKHATKSSTNPQLFNHAKYQECTFNTRHSQVVLTIPFTVTPSFQNEIVSYEWKLHFSFEISQNIEQATNTVYSRSEDGIQEVAPRHLNVQMMTWDFPIKIVATHPANVAKAFQMASIGTLSI